jgi:hypothetical protein
MSTKRGSHLWRTSGSQDQATPDPLCRSLERSLCRDPLSEGPQRPEGGNSRWNTGGPLISFVFFDLTRNLLVMRPHIRPCVRKVFGAQCRIGLQKLRLTCSKPPCPFEEPHWNSRPHNARFTSAYISSALDSRKGIADIARRPLQQLRLFGTTKFAEQFFGLFQSAHRHRQGAARLSWMQADLS